MGKSGGGVLAGRMMQWVIQWIVTTDYNGDFVYASWCDGNSTYYMLTSYFFRCFFTSCTRFARIPRAYRRHSLRTCWTQVSTVLTQQISRSVELYFQHSTRFSSLLTPTLVLRIDPNWLAQTPYHAPQLNQHRRLGNQRDQCSCH